MICKLKRVNNRIMAPILSGEIDNVLYYNIFRHSSVFNTTIFRPYGCPRSHYFKRRLLFLMCSQCVCNIY